MIDISNIKSPGWQRVVTELNLPAPDDRAYLERLVRVLAQVSGARRAVLFSPNRTDGEEVEPQVEMVWPPASGAEAVTGGGGQVRPSKSAAIEQEAEARSAARAAFTTGQARAFGLDKQESYYDAGPQQGFLLAVPLVQAVGVPNAKGEQAFAIQGVVTLLIEPRAKDAVRSTLAMAEVLAGYLSGHTARSALQRTQSASLALDLATRLIASINTSTNFKGAAIQIVNDLAKQFALDRVSLGWVRSDKVRVESISDVEHFDRRMVTVQKLQAAMDECLDQEQAIVYPQPPAEGPGGDVLLSQSIVHSHRELAAGNASAKVCSIPLRTDEDVVGVVTLEVAGETKPDVAWIEMIQAAMDLIAPVLRIRKSDDRILPLRAYDDGVKAAGWLVGTKHTVWKLAGVAVIALAAFVALYQTTYRPGADATIEPRVRRVVSVPFDAQIRRLGPGIEPGRDVAEGDLLVELDTEELRLGLADANAKILQARTQIAAAQREQDQGKVKQAEAQLERAIAEAALYDYRIKRSRIAAPISGRIIAGDLKDKIGASVKLGETLMQIAALDDLIVTARVEESDIRFVRAAFERAAGEGERAAGSIATKASPARPLAFTVERIVPLAQAGEGKNTFEVRARLDDTPENRERLRDYTLVVGMEGVAKFDTERMSLLEIGTRKIIDTVRLWLW